MSSTQSVGRDELIRDIEGLLLDEHSFQRTYKQRLEQLDLISQDQREMLQGVLAGSENVSRIFLEILNDLRRLEREAQTVTLAPIEHELAPIAQHKVNQLT